MQLTSGAFLAGFGFCIVLLVLVAGLFFTLVWYKKGVSSPPSKMVAVLVLGFVVLFLVPTYLVYGTQRAPSSILSEQRISLDPGEERTTTILSSGSRNVHVEAFDIHGQNVNLKVLADGKNVATYNDTDSKVECSIPSTRALITLTAGNPSTSERRDVNLRVTQGDPE
ncbi:MAG: hypothetical protein SGI72_09680 [Planctomycetota bacterium]|nr:hypothetical protein [Planctomycetota bacterium]